MAQFCSRVVALVVLVLAHGFWLRVQATCLCHLRHQPCLRRIRFCASSDLHSSHTGSSSGVNIQRTQNQAIGHISVSHEGLCHAGNCTMHWHGLLYLAQVLQRLCGLRWVMLPEGYPQLDLLVRDLRPAQMADFCQILVEMNDYRKDRFVKRMNTSMFNIICNKAITLSGFAFKMDLDAPPEPQPLKPLCM